MANETSSQKSPRQKYILDTGRFRIPLGDSTKIMGIVNVTPDSFSQDGCLSQLSKASGNPSEKAVRQGMKMIRQGADILDIGGESSRPGSKRVSAKEELARVIPAITQLAKKVNIPISIDTYKTSVAKNALDAGACIVNNIKGAQPERSLLKMVRNYNAAIVLMHMQGMPQTMQKNIVYRNVFEDILKRIQISVENCLEIGIKSDRIIIDPGIGFGKTCEHNLLILKHLDRFKRLNLPILIGTSRKSFIGQVLNKDVRHRLWGTAATVSASIINGAHIVRVHDVKEIKDTVTMTDAIINS